jgi:hypothetical protein
VSFAVRHFDSLQQVHLVTAYVCAHNRATGSLWNCQCIFAVTDCGCCIACVVYAITDCM